VIKFRSYQFRNRAPEPDFWSHNVEDMERINVVLNLSGDEQFKDLFQNSRFSSIGRFREAAWSPIAPSQYYLARIGSEKIVGERNLNLHVECIVDIAQSVLIECNAIDFAYFPRAYVNIHLWPNHCDSSSFSLSALNMGRLADMGLNVDFDYTFYGEHVIDDKSETK
jgi:hypothetical protein